MIGLNKTMKSLICSGILIMLVYGTLKTNAADIFEVNRKLGRGMNLGNFLEPPRNSSWAIALNENHLAVIKKAGFDNVRIPVKWSDYASPNPPYAIEPDFFLRIDRLLDRGEKEDLKVVLNIHHYDGLDADPDSHIDRFVALWKQIAARYKSRGDWLYFELDNEPHEKLNDRWNEVLLKGLAAIRESNPTRAVIVGPTHWNGIWALSQLELPSDPNLIVTVHMYNPHEFTHQGASWADERVRAIKDLSWGSEQEQAALQKELDQAATWGKTNGRPIYLGEFGAYQAAPLDSRIRWTTAVAKAATARQMSWSYWEFGSGFGAYDLAKNEWRNDLLKALIAK